MIALPRNVALLPPQQLIDMPLFDNEGNAIYLDKFQQQCLAHCECDAEALPDLDGTIQALFIVTAKNHKQLQRHLIGRTQQCHILAWFALGRLLALRPFQDVDWSESRLSVLFPASEQHPRFNDWTALRCRAVTQALSLWFHHEHTEVLMNREWWRAIEEVHARIVEIACEFLRLHPQRRITDIPGIAEMHDVFMDCYYLRHGLSQWLIGRQQQQQQQVLPTAITVTHQFEKLVDECRAWILEQADSDRASEMPLHVMSAIHDKAVRPGDVSKYLRASCLPITNVHAQFCLEVARTPSALLWLFQEERYASAREQLRAFPAGLSQRMYAVIVLHVFDRWFVMRYGISWLAAACADETTLSHRNAHQFTPVQFIFCGGGFLIRYQIEDRTMLIMCNDVYTALVTWLCASCYQLGERGCVTMHKDKLVDFSSIKVELLNLLQRRLQEHMTSIPRVSGS